MRLPAHKSSIAQSFIQSQHSLHVQTEEGLPSLVIRNGRSLDVVALTCLESVQGRWWLDWEHRGVKRRTYRVELTDNHGHAFAAHLAQQGPCWSLSQILD